MTFGFIFVILSYYIDNIIQQPHSTFFFLFYFGHSQFCYVTQAVSRNIVIWLSNKDRRGRGQQFRKDTN